MEKCPQVLLSPSCCCSTKIHLPGSLLSSQASPRPIFCLFSQKIPSHSFLLPLSTFPAPQLENRCCFGGGKKGLKEAVDLSVIGFQAAETISSNARGTLLKYPCQTCRSGVIKAQLAAQTHSSWQGVLGKAKPSKAGLFSAQKKISHDNNNNRNNKKIFKKEKIDVSSEWRNSLKPDRHIARSKKIMF